MNRNFIIISLFLCIAVTQVSASQSWIRDEDGRALILHGLNISDAAKGAPDYTSWHTFEDYARMRDEWGFNAIRLLIFWAAVEPEPWVYDDEYLDRVAERVGWASELGLYVIIDMHQDLYGEKFNSDGAPQWATWDDGLPYEPTEPWWTNYLQPAVCRAFTNLWVEEELQEHLIAAWTHVAERFAGDPTVLGYDLFNEPYFGEFQPWFFEMWYLHPFYLDLVRAMKTVDPDHLYFYEPEIATSSGIPSFLGVLPEDNLVYIPHFYHPLVHEGYPYPGNPFLLETAMRIRDIEANRAGIPWVLGEFGVAAETGGMDQYLKDLLGLLNRKKAGWTYWSYDRGGSGSFGIIDSEGIEREQLQYLVHPYAQRIPGDPIRTSYSFDDRLAVVRFRENGYSSGPTEIYVGADRIYPEGFTVLCSDPEGDWSWEYDDALDIVRVWTDPEKAAHWIAVAPDTAGYPDQFSTILRAGSPFSTIP